MPYTIPHISSVPITLKAPAQLQSPLGADFSWADNWVTPFLATRFGAATLYSPIISTRFGTPTLRLVNFVATAGVVVTFGDPRVTRVFPASPIPAGTAFGLAVALPMSTGFLATKFGAANARYNQFWGATGTNATQYGAPRLLTVAGYAFAALPSTVVSTAYTRVAQTCAASGAAVTRYGRPSRSSSAPQPPADIVGAAIGWKGTAFGTSAAPYALSVRAYGFSLTRFGASSSRSPGTSTRFGVPTLQLKTAAQGNLFGSFGAPALRYATQGFRSTSFGVGFTRRGNLASGFASTRFGAAAAFVKGHRAYSIYVGQRFGVPRATNRINYPATGWSSTVLGTPNALDRHRASSIAPATAFGTPLLRRNPAC